MTLREPVTRPPDTGPVSDRSRYALLAGLALVTALPYALLGPNFIQDDWWVLRNIHFDGVLAAAGEPQLRARPGAWFVFTVVFGTFGTHPLAAYLFQTALKVLAGGLLFRVLRRYVRPWTSFAVVAVWLMAPTHTTMERWASNSQAMVALLLVLAGALLLERACDQGKSPVPAIVVLVAASLCYESSIPVAGALVVAVPVLTTGRLRWSWIVGAAAALGLTLLWMLRNSQMGFSVRPSFLDLVHVHAGRGMTISYELGQVLMVGALVGLVLIVVGVLRPALRSSDEAVWLAGAGLALLLVGTAAYYRFPIAWLGITDRAHLYGAIGASMLWVGMGLAILRWRAVLVVVAVGFGALLGLGRLERDVAWARAGDDAVTILEALDEQFADVDGEVVVGPARRFHTNITGIHDDWDTSAAWQLTSDDRTRRADFARSEEEFEAAPEDRRLDWRTLDLHPGWWMFRDEADLPN